jgi:uncharacterized protein
MSRLLDVSASAGPVETGSSAGAPARREGEHRRSPLGWVLLGLVTLYRATAPLRAPRCRFHPTCSSYAVVAIERHGAARGGWLALRRLGRCHPWNPGGVDHVPPRK